MEEREGRIGDEKEKERGKEIEPGVVVVFFSSHLRSGSKGSHLLKKTLIL